MPARSPAQRLQRLLAVARFDAISLVVVAAPAALIALTLREWFAASVGAAVSFCGWLEWTGARRLARSQPSGALRLVAAQLLCLAAILLYARHLAGQVRADHILQLLPSFTREQLFLIFPDAGSADAFLLFVQRLMVAAIALVAVIYQGGMALYYLRSRRFIRALLAAPPPLGHTPPAQR
ncbi:MAG TPA: hypothetical protein VK178_18360 [Opitutaceae bacterium]|nr:hypothetical protein [Opitutaceae bacterium]